MDKELLERLEALRDDESISDEERWEQAGKIYREEIFVCGTRGKNVVPKKDSLTE